MATSGFPACVQSVCRASSVTDAVAGHFVHPTSNDLVLVKANVVALHTWDEAHSCLRLVSETVLPSRVVAIATLPQTGGGIDAVATLFGETNVVITQWNAEEYAWKTIAAYCLAPPAAATTPCVSERATGLPPLLRVDVEHEVLAVLTHRQYLHVIPFPATNVTSSKISAATAVTAAAAVDEGWGDEDDEDTVTEAPAHAEVATAAAGGGHDVPTPFAPAVLDLFSSPTSLRNIRDVVFASGLDQSTVAVLREAEPTWAGRVKLLGVGGTLIKALSCGVSLIQLGYTRARNAAVPSSLAPIVLHSAEGLPFDTLSLHPAPAPLGGVLVLSAGSIAHMSTRGSHFGILLNNHAKEMTQADRSDVHWNPTEWHGSASKTALYFGEGATLLYVSGSESEALRWIVTAKDSGIMYQLTLLHDGRSVHRGIVTRLASLVQAHSVASLSPNVAFLGSFITDSAVIAINPPSGSVHSGDPIKLKVLTSIPGIGPVTDFDLVDATTPESAKPSNPTSIADAENNPFETVLAEGLLDPKPQPLPLRDALSATSLVLCGGRGERHGSLTVVSRHARVLAVLRRVIDCRNVFSFSSHVDAASPRKRDRDTTTATKGVSADGQVTRVMLMATSSTTIAVEVLEDTLRQVGPNESGFILDRRSVAALTLEHSVLGRVALQFVVNADQLGGAVAAVKFDDLSAVGGSPLALTTVPVAALADGDKAFVLDGSGRLWHLTLAPAWSCEPVETPEAITAMCSLCGSEALLFTALGHALVFDTKSRQVVATVKKLSGLPSVAHADGEEAAPRIAVVVKQPAKPEPNLTVTSASAAVLNGARDSTEHKRPIADVWITLALLLSNGELCVYRVTTAPPHKRWNFTKVAFDVHDVPPPTAAETSIAEKRLRKQISTDDGRQLFHPSIVYVPTLGTVDGFLVPGVNPKLIVSDKGMPRIHPLRLPDDPTATAFAPLNYSACQNGLITASSTQVLFALLFDDNAGVDLRSFWPRSHVPTGGTPHKVAYSATHRATFVATSRLEKYRPTKAPFDAELEINLESGTTKVIEQTLLKPVGEEEGIPIPMGERFSIRLFSTALSVWNHADTVTLDENETVVAMTACDLLVKITPNALPTLCDVVAVGTAFRLGEDHACRGRLHVYRVAVAHDQKKIVSVVSENTKGPVTAIASLRGLLVVAVGASVRVMELDWTAKKLRTVSFVHAPAFVTSLSVFKSYVVIGDLHRSLVVARYTDATGLHLIAADPTSKDSLAVGTVFGSSKTLAVTSYDMKDNVQLFAVHPKLNSGGDTLTSALEPIAHFKLSGTVRKAVRVRHVNAARNALRDTSADLFITAEGEIGFITPVSESTHRNCGWVVNRVAAETEQPFALHAQSSRQGTLSESMGCAGAPLIDAQVLRRFIALSVEERRCIAARSGLATTRALGLLVSIQQDTAFF